MVEPSKSALAGIVRYHFMKIENHVDEQHSEDGALNSGIADLRQALNDYFGAIKLNKLGPKGSEPSSIP